MVSLGLLWRRPFRRAEFAARQALLSRSGINMVDPGCGQLPKPLIVYIDPPGWGHVAEWLRSGLQNRLLRFNSGRGLHQ
jgi:hypothetical protein